MTFHLQADNLAAASGVRHGFFTRKGGVSTGLYASLNCRLGSDDERGKVLENRDRVRRAMGARVLCTPYQTHSPTCARLDEPWDWRDPPHADAIATTRRGVAIGVATADCTPVLFADRAAGVIGAAHAGWKGALGGVLEATIAKMEELGAKRGDIACAIGPVISRPNYEVGPEFPARFIDRDPRNARFFVPSRRPGHHLFDLPGFVAHVLEEAGISSLADIGRCTYGEEDLFFSYRRNTHAGEKRYGCQLAVIMLEP